MCQYTHPQYQNTTAPLDDAKSTSLAHSSSLWCQSLFTSLPFIPSSLLSLSLHPASIFCFFFFFFYKKTAFSHSEHLRSPTLPQQHTERISQTGEVMWKMGYKLQRWQRWGEGDITVHNSALGYSFFPNNKECWRCARTHAHTQIKAFPCTNHRWFSTRWCLVLCWHLTHLFSLHWIRMTART